MESLLVQALMQAGAGAEPGWVDWCSYWDWVFWIGALVGLVGAVVLFFLRPVDTA